ncbi:L-seryl-tRNA(Sec) selenium transferase [uncultured Finegoldia sp.]|uniref:L-seryl-tRNA(Sec) selenium transferase n=1 Tax=uncultured Finegoldia sp. TaxID=328009 RepID=UPI00260D1585|nr:L-seryl-tRNA(Sec) selenium transferase [uncultured Finegoldia sp.]
MEINMKEMFKKLPQVSEILESDEITKKSNDYPEIIVKDSVRESIEFFRNRILNKENFDFNNEDVIKKAIEFMDKNFSPSLKPVINATGVILHTNLGRSLLNEKVVDNLCKIAANYSNLEYDLDLGKRGSRYVHAVELLKRITKAEDAVVVNNNAAAVFLVLNTLAYNKEAIISRGELVEVGGSFRISSIMEKSGAKLVEVGSTNKTHMYDYEDNINENTALIMKVHTSNFSVVGFSESVSGDELRSLCNEKSIHLIEDLGSGSLIDLSRFGLSYERTVKDCINEGIDLVSFSGDKILGGPQAGIIVGKKELIAKIKKNQLLRAFRVDKFTLGALEETLKFYLDENTAIENIPTLKMISMPLEEIMRKAEKLKSMIEKEVDLDMEIVKTQSEVGGGSYPIDKLNSYSIAVKPKIKVSEFERRLRLSDEHIIGTVHDDTFFMDLRCVFERDFERIVNVIKSNI